MAICLGESKGGYCGGLGRCSIAIFEMGHCRCLFFARLRIEHGGAGLCLFGPAVIVTHCHRDRDATNGLGRESWGRGRENDEG